MSITDDIINIQDSLGKYIVSPANLFGFSGFVFDVEGQTNAELTSAITDSYAENNSSRQDNIARMPKRVTLKQYIGELVFRQDKSTNTLLQNVTQKLTVLNSYLPVLSQAATQIQKLSTSRFSLTNILGNIDLNQSASLYASVKNLIPPTTRQQQAYLFFKSLWEQAILMSVQTPFEFMANMAIEKVVAIQDEDTREMSNFTITLKEMRFAQTQTNIFDPNQYKSPNLNSGANRGVQGISSTNVPLISPSAPPPVNSNPNTIQSSPVDQWGQTFGTQLTPQAIQSITRAAGELSQTPLP